MNSINARWYLSAAATREYLAIAGLADDDGGPNWRRAEEELARHSHAARMAMDEGHQEIWRTSKVQVGDQAKTTRLEFTVKKGEGPLPALVRVRSKGK